MKEKLLLFPAMVAALLISCPVFAQGMGHHNGGYHPDSLTTVTLTGGVITDTVSVHHHNFYLDEDFDGTADYHLNFSPFWYQPDSSQANRPAAGDTVEITGGMHESLHDTLDVIVVYEINGDFWRNPLAPGWAHMGNGHSNRHHRNFGHGSFAFGMMNDSLETATVTGTTLIDSTVQIGRAHV